MLRITKAEDQAVRLVMQLATTGEQMTLGQLAEQEALPEPTVAKLLGLLRRGGVVEAIRGRHGGYVLARDPGDISAADVLRALGGDPAPDHPCVEDPENGGGCPRTGDCGLRAVWRHLQLQVAGLLEKTSVADLLRVEASVDGRLHQLWPREDGGPEIIDAKRAFSEGA
ncbi:MAG: Rrf2 family transcriptional regulator [Candidatus Krumholzibacteriia bacterium]